MKFKYDDDKWDWAFSSLYNHRHLYSKKDKYDRRLMAENDLYNRGDFFETEVLVNIMDEIYDSRMKKLEGREHGITGYPTPPV